MDEVARRTETTSIKLGEDGQSYDWLEDWAEYPRPRGRPRLGHHGLAMTRSGELIGFHPERSEIVVLDGQGRFLRSWPVGLKEGHGITLVEEAGRECVWVADPGSKMRRAPGGDYRPDVAADQGQVVKFGLDGSEVARLGRPPHPAYASGRYAPTAVAVDEVRHGGSGDIWVGDGYGESLVHRYRADGTYLSSLSGEEGAGRFKCPHAVFIDRRHAEGELG